MGRKPKYDFSTYEVLETRIVEGPQKSIAVCASVYGKENNKKFSVKKVKGLVGSENGEKDAERVEVTRTA